MPVGSSVLATLQDQDACMHVGTCNKYNVQKLM